jgi:ankyrin repeat protein
MWASMEGHTAIVQALLEAGADRTVRGKVTPHTSQSCFITEC